MKRRNNVIKKGNKTLELFEENKRIVPFIKATTDLCDEIFSKTKIGSGSQGKIYKIKFRNDRKIYIMKKTHLTLFNIGEQDVIQLKKYISKFTKDVSKLKMKKFINLIMDFYDLNDRISWRKILKFNHLTKYEIPSYDLLDEFFLPIEDIDCLITKPKTYDYNLDFEGTIEAKKGDYVCFSNVFVETLISLIMSKLVRDEICYHYIVFYASILCDDSFEFFIEKMDSSLTDLIFNSDVEINEIFDISNLFSVIISIYIMTDKFNICHNDLAFRNILVKKNKLSFDKITYIIDDIIFEFPFPKYLYKISDFGYAQKFSHPMILDIETLTGQGYIVPNFDTRGLFDLFKFFYDLISYIYRDLNDETKKYVDPFLNLLFGSKEDAIDIILEDEDESNIYEITKDVLIDTKLILDVKLMTKIFKKFIVKKVSDNSFIAVKYTSSSD